MYLQAFIDSCYVWMKLIKKVQNLLLNSLSNQVILLLIFGPTKQWPNEKTHFKIMEFDYFRTTILWTIICSLKTTRLSYILVPPTTWDAFDMAKNWYTIVKEGRREEGETVPYYLIVAV